MQHNASGENTFRKEAVVTRNTQKWAILSLGANVKGSWGSRAATLSNAIGNLNKLFTDLRASPVYESEPVGTRAQPPFLNILIIGRPLLSPHATMRELKRLEWKAGRRPGQRWGPRPLDVDIADWSGRVLNWHAGINWRSALLPSRRWRGSPLVLPHPELHRRKFVLVPLHEIAPNWRHPVFGSSAKQLVTSLRRANQRLVLWDSGNRQD